MGRLMRAPDHDAGTGDGGDAGDPDAGKAADASNADQQGNADDSGSDKGGDPGAASADAKDGDADKSLMNGGAKDGDDDKGDGDKGDEPDLPEKYDITPPEGFEVNDEILAEADPVFRDLKLTNEQANKLMPLAASFAGRIAQQQADAHQAMATGWAKEAKADKELGGANWKETEALVARALDKFAGPAKNDKGDPNPFRQLLDETKLGNHPEMIRMFRKIGAAVSEDGDLPRGDSGAAVKQDRLAVLYPNDAPKKETA